jgi:hypothetical protein
MTTDNHDQFLQELQRIAESTSYPWRMPIRSFEYNYDVWGWQHGARKLTLYPVGALTFDYFAEDVAAESQSDVDSKLENFKDLWNWLHDSVGSPPSWNYDQLVEDREHFHAFLEENSKIVASWPEWKRNMLGLVVNDADHAGQQTDKQLDKHERVRHDKNMNTTDNENAVASLEARVQKSTLLTRHPDYQDTGLPGFVPSRTEEDFKKREHNRLLELRLLAEFQEEALKAVGLTGHPKASECWDIAKQQSYDVYPGLRYSNRDDILPLLQRLARLVK